MIEILRLNHRLPRDCRITTHVALVARAFGAIKMYYSGQKDSEMEESVNSVVKRFGGPFDIEYVNSAIKLINEKNEYNIVHLTVYGLPYKKVLKNLNKNVLIIVGGDKVEWDIYKLANYNLSVSSQPHSEVGALAIFLNDLHGDVKKFKNFKLQIVPKEREKVLKEFKWIYKRWLI